MSMSIFQNMKFFPKPYWIPKLQKSSIGNMITTSGKQYVIKSLSGKITAAFKIYWNLSTILKRSSKSVWSNVFWYVKIYIFWKFIQYTMHWDKTRILKIFSSGKINSPTFSFNSQFLYELKYKVRLSKILCGISHFWICFVFIKVYIFVQQKAQTFWL